uniref:Uncharacterized protein n=1 Tax=Cannabis sativa TaxID=3483 RepID=A0A803QRZ8_CANSA
SKNPDDPPSFSPRTQHPESDQIPVMVVESYHKIKLDARKNKEEEQAPPPSMVVAIGSSPKLVS